MFLIFALKILTTLQNLSQLFGRMSFSLEQKIDCFLMFRFKINISEGVLHNVDLNFSGPHIRRYIYIYDFKFYF